MKTTVILLTSILLFSTLSVADFESDNPLSFESVEERREKTQKMLMGGDEGDSCSTITCFSSLLNNVEHDTPKECGEFFDIFFGIAFFKRGKLKKAKTFEERWTFLNMCPLLPHESMDNDNPIITVQFVKDTTMARWGHALHL